MLQRAIFLYAFFAVAVVSTGAAVWQKLETNLRDEQLSDSARLLVAARSEVRELKERANTAERRVRLLESASPERAADNADASPPDEVEKLRAELAAARQQLSAAETAMQETEDRLASEIADHAALKAKAQELSDEVAATGRNITAIEGKTASEATGSLPDSAASDGSAAPAAVAAPPAVKKTVKRASKPVIRAVKPIGSIEPLL